MRSTPSAPPAATKKSIRVSSPALVDHHEPAGAEARQLALADERGEDGADRGVDRVPALAQHLRARLGGQRMTGGDDSPRTAHAGSVGVLGALVAGAELGHVEDAPVELARLGRATPDAAAAPDAVAVELVAPLPLRGCPS